MKPITFIKSIFNGSRKRTVSTLLSAEEFRAILKHECARCDRNGHEFSLVLIDTEHAGKKRHMNHFVRYIIQRMRMTDELGWFDERHIGVFLPETSGDGAQAFIRDICSEICEEVCQDNHCRSYTYPSPLPAGISGNGRAQEPRGGDGDRPSGADRSSPPEEHSDAQFHSELKTYINHRQCGGDELKEMLMGTRLPIWKRTLDIIGSLIGLVILSPVFLVISAYIKIVSPGPVFFRQERIGYLGRPFTMWKFRTMRTNADTHVHEEYLKSLISSDEEMVKLDHNRDDRLIPLAGLMRKTCIDELPQLINVLLGDMSLVGPRPCLRYEAEEFQLWQNQRFHTLPGMTGLWQVSGKNRTTFKQMMRLDIRYSRRGSPYMDLLIFAKTVPAIIGQIADSYRCRRKELSRGAPVGSNPRVSRTLGSFVRQIFL